MAIIQSKYFPECDRALIRASLCFMEASIFCLAPCEKKQRQLFHALVKLGVKLQQPARQEDLIWAVQAGLSGA